MEVSGSGALVAVAEGFLDVAGGDAGGLEPVGEGVPEAVGGDAVAEPRFLAGVGEGVVDQGGGDDAAAGTVEHQRVGWFTGCVG